MTTGSRWYSPLFEGLCEKKHVGNMGQAIWLYLWMLGRAHVAQDHGVFTYTHVEAAKDLGKSIRTIKTWFSRLQESGYFITRARRPYTLEVEVTNWRTPEEWLNARQVEGQYSALPFKRSAERSAERSATSGIPLLTIKLLSYEYPTGTEVQNPASLSGAFGHFLGELKSTTNRPALLRQLYQLCFGEKEDDLPSYGYLGKVAKKVGGAGRLAELMWRLTAKPPTGDVLAYIQGIAKHQAQQTQDKTGQLSPADLAAMQEEYAHD